MTGPRDLTKTQAGTITVMVTFFADLRRFLPRGADGPQRYTVPERATVDDLLAMIGVAPDTDLTIAVDGEQAARDTPLKNAPTSSLLPPMKGEPQPQAGRPRPQEVEAQAPARRPT